MAKSEREATEINAMKQSIFVYLATAAAAITLHAQGPVTSIGIGINNKPDPNHIGPAAPDPKLLNYDPHTSKVGDRSKLFNFQQTVQSQNKAAPRPMPIKPTITIAASEIPGIQFIKPTDPGFSALPDTKLLNPADGFVIKNTSKHNIVSLSVRYYFGTHPLDMGFDGLDAPINVPPGGSIAVGPFFLKASNSTNHISDSMDMGGNATSAHIAFVVFADGSYYGSSASAKVLMDKAKNYKSFIGAIESAKDAAAFLDTAVECSRNKDCIAASNVGPEEWYFRTNALEAYKATKALDPEHNSKRAAAQFLNSQREMINRFPVIKSITNLSTDLAPEVVRPDSPQNGWYAINVYANCDNGLLFYSGSLTNGCTFPSSSPSIANSPSFTPAPPGALLSPTPAGFTFFYKAECLGYAPGPMAIQSTQSLSDGWTTMKIVKGTDQSQALYAPRQMVYSNYSDNYGQYALGPDTFYSNSLTGIVEPNRRAICTHR